MNKMTSLYREGMAELREENAQLRQRIAELEDQQRWIPVSERTPEKDVRVLITNGKSMAVGWVDYDEKWVDFDCWDECYSGNTTHWMPLPEPPEVNHARSND